MHEFTSPLPEQERSLPQRLAEMKAVDTIIGRVLRTNADKEKLGKRFWVQLSGYCDCLATTRIAELSESKTKKEFCEDVCVGKSELDTCPFLHLWNAEGDYQEILKAARVGIRNLLAWADSIEEIEAERDEAETIFQDDPMKQFIKDATEAAFSVDDEDE
jgi:hypothetical protein